jgi:hypothetical protein
MPRPRCIPAALTDTTRGQSIQAIAALDFVQDNPLHPARSRPTQRPVFARNNSLCLWPHGSVTMRGSSSSCQIGLKNPCQIPGNLTAWNPSEPRNPEPASVCPDRCAQAWPDTSGSGILTGPRHGIRSPWNLQENSGSSISILPFTISSDRVSRLPRPHCQGRCTSLSSDW